MENSNIFGKIHYKFFSNNGAITPLGLSGMVLDPIRIILFVIAYHLFGYVDTFEIITLSIGIAYLFAPIICMLLMLPKANLLKNTPKRFVIGAYIPIPYAIIWLLAK